MKICYIVFYTCSKLTEEATEAVLTSSLCFVLLRFYATLTTPFRESFLAIHQY